MVATLVEESAVIQGGYSKCTDEKNKEKLAMKFHTTRRSFDEGVFCCADDFEEWKATAKGGRVFGLAEFMKLWFYNKLTLVI
jgi:hypothetical protein